MALSSSKAAIRDIYSQASYHVPNTISPRSWLRSYETFVKQNAQQVSQIESALRSLTYIIPGRFSESPLALESLYTSLALLSSYHTSLLPSLHPSPLTRYTNFYALRSTFYARCAQLLRTIQYTELLCEMYFKRRGERARWRLVVVLELIKAICRAIILRTTGRRGVSPPLSQEREVLPEETEDDDEFSSSSFLSVDPTTTTTKPHTLLSRTNCKLAPLPPPSQISDFLSNHALSPWDVKPPSQLMHTLSTASEYTSEILFIVRPLVYALAMQRYQADKRNWTPWVLGLAIEIGARQIGRRKENEWRSWSGVEREEFSRRGTEMAWWGMRGAFYQRITRVWIQGFAAKLKGKPLLDILGGLLMIMRFCGMSIIFLLRRCK